MEATAYTNREASKQQTASSFETEEQAQSPERPSFRTLQKWLRDDTRAYEAQEDHLRRLELTPPKRMTVAERQKVVNWDYAVIRSCKEHAEILRTIKNATFEEERARAMIQELALCAGTLERRAMKLADRLADELGALEDDIGGESVGSEDGPPHDENSVDGNRDQERSGQGEDRPRRSSEISNVAVIGSRGEDAAPDDDDAESSDTDSEENAQRRWKACVGQGPTSPVRLLFMK
ncbi:Hypothetical predicted protein [Lecanosticta acicola]|uniref:Uncharacterized protein n=1 Tax=Lecanosticta acicola TaxID=111012 RepID=A0AAI8Z6U3_9PEZI|nr:Hypothetical predicted protein [Lecanosticta acicola]